jgi:chromosome segregation ATPase
MMDGSGAVKQEYERELEMKNQKIRELEEELAVSEGLTADLMLNINSVEQQVRKYAEEPAILRADDCECKQQVSAVADLLKNLSAHRGTQISPSQKPHLAGTPKLTAKPKQKQTAGRGIVPTLLSRKL